MALTHGNASETLRWLRHLTAELREAELAGRADVSNMFIAQRLIAQRSPLWDRAPATSWFNFKVLAQLQPYAAYPVYVSRMLQLRFLSTHRVVMLDSSEASHALAQALTMCLPDRLAYAAEEHCGLQLQQNGSAADPELKRRLALCALIRPVPWKASQLICGYEAVDGLPRLPDARSRAARQRHTARVDFSVAVVQHPVLKAFRAFLSCSKGSSGQLSLSETGLQQFLHTTESNPLLWRLTPELAPNSSLQERFEAAVAAVWTPSARCSSRRRTWPWTSAR